MDTILSDLVSRGVVFGEAALALVGAGLLISVGIGWVKKFGTEAAIKKEVRHSERWAASRGGALTDTGRAEIARLQRNASSGEVRITLGKRS